MAWCFLRHRAYSRIQNKNSKPETIWRYGIQTYFCAHFRKQVIFSSVKLTINFISIYLHLLIIVSIHRIWTVFISCFGVSIKLFFCHCRDPLDAWNPIHVGIQFCGVQYTYHSRYHAGVHSWSGQIWQSVFQKTVYHAPALQVSSGTITEWERENCVC